MSKFNAKKMVMISLFIALQIVLTRIFGVTLLTVRIAFTFVPLAMCSMMFGPITGGVAAAIADLIGFILFPSGPFFPGFTITAFLSGAAYGVFMYNKEVKLSNVLPSVLVVTVILNLGLDTLWLILMYDLGFMAIIPGRIIKTAVMIPVQTVLIMSVWRLVVVRFKENFA